MFNTRLKPCAAGDRCHLKPTLADPQHKCPKCRRHIHAICGVPDVNCKNDMNSRLCFKCFKAACTPDLHQSPASSETTPTSNSTTKTINLHRSPESTATTSTNTTSPSSTLARKCSSSTMAQNYLDSIGKIDDSTDVSSHILFSRK